MKFKLSFMVIAIVSLALGSAHAVYAAPLTKACSLLTQAQVSAALGVKVGAGRSIMGPEVCNWPAPFRAGTPPIRAELNFVILAAFDAAKKEVGYRVAKTTEARGIGDDAVYTSYTDPHEPPILTVKKGNTAFTIVVTGFSNDQAKAKEKTLALEVCSKL